MQYAIWGVISDCFLTLNTIIKQIIKDFNNLIAWLFVKMNKIMAEHFEKSPCDEETMDKFGYNLTELNIDKILPNIKRRLVVQTSLDGF